MELLFCDDLGSRQLITNSINFAYKFQLSHIWKSMIIVIHMQNIWWN